MNSKAVGRHRVEDIAFEQERQRAQRQQKYLKQLKRIQGKKNAAPDGNPEAAKHQ